MNCSLHFSKFFYKNVKNTSKESIVKNSKIFLCFLTYKSKQVINCKFQKVFCTARMLKHIYDKRPAEEFDCILNNLYKIVRFPDEIYLNYDSKRGSFIFKKSLDAYIYICSIELLNNNIYVATCFRDYKGTYLKNYKLLWSWKDGYPSS